jgi:CspA family cold shock protein
MWTTLRQSGHEDLKARGYGALVQAVRGSQRLAGHEGARRRFLDGRDTAPKPPPMPDGIADGRLHRRAGQMVQQRARLRLRDARSRDGDIFVHAAVLRRHGMDSLAPGQKVMVRIAEGQKGLQVVEIRAA